MSILWLWIAIALVLASQTAHLKELLLCCNLSFSNVFLLGNVFLNFRSIDGSHCHWHWFGGAQPVAVIVSASIIADGVEIAKQVGHG